MKLTEKAKENITLIAWCILIVGLMASSIFIKL